jgi:type IV pilus assembly protein PilF
MKRLKNILKQAVMLLCIVTVIACAASSWNQEQAESHLNIGEAYLGSQRYNEALKELFQAEKLTPRDPKVHYNMGAAYYMKGMSDKAIDEFNKAISFDSKYSEAYNFLGTIYLEKGQWDKAIQSLQHALSNTLYDTPDKALFNMGRAYHSKGDYQTALKRYQEAKNTKPNTIDPVIIEQHMGMAAFAKGSMEEAISHFRQTLELMPSFLEMHYWLGQSYLKQNKLAEARAEFNHVIKEAPNSELAASAKKDIDAIDSLRYKQ